MLVSSFMHEQRARIHSDGDHDRLWKHNQTGLIWTFTSDPSLFTQVHTDAQVGVGVIWNDALAAAYL